MANRITTILDLDNRGFVKSAKSVRREIADTDGSLNKLKAGAKGAFAGLQQYSGEAALAAGAALVAFGAKSVAAFQDTALSAGQLRDSLGVTAEEASRLQEVAEDLGIGTATLEKSIGIMNRTATNTPSAFAAIGAELVKNADGTTNVNETFLATIDALNKIPDASARAAAAQKVFGRGWQDMSELIMLGADGVREALASVEDGKVIDDSEIERARKFRDSLDTLRGAVEELQIEIGSGLVPVLTDVIDSVVRTKAAVGDLTDAVPGLGKAFGVVSDQLARVVFWPKYILDAKDALTETTDTVGTLGESIKAFEAVNSVSAQAYVEHAEGMQRETEKVADEAEKATARIEKAWGDLNRELSDRSTYLDIEDAFDNVAQTALVALDTVGKSFAEQEADARAHERAVLDLQGQVAKYAEEIALLPPEAATELLAMIDEGAFAEVERRLATLEKIRIARITPETYIPGGGRFYGSSSNGAQPRIHDGGMVTGNGVQSFAGLRDDEVPAILQKGEAVLTKGQQAAIGGGGMTVNLTVNAGMGANGRDIGRIIVEELQKYQRRNGPGSLPS